MAKRKRPAPSRTTTAVDLTRSRWFIPAVFVFLLLALVVLFSDFIFSDQMMQGSDTLQQGYMFRNFLVDYFDEHGAIPKWIPYYFGGMPYIEAFHGDIFYPLTLLKFAFPLKRMLGWHLFLHIFLAGVFMYFCARQFKLDKLPSALAAACYMFAPYIVSMVSPGHDGKIYATAMFPLIILFLDRGFERRPLLNFSLVGMVVGLVIVSPHAQMSYFSLWGLSLYAAFKLIMLFVDTKSIVPLIKPSLFTTYAVGLGLLLSAIQFYPGYVYTTEYSPRSESKRGWEWSISWSMHEEEAMGLLIPEFAGANTRGTETYYWGKNWFKDNCESVGAVTFMLALFGFLFYRRRASYFFGGLGLFALIYSLGATTPIFRLFFWVIPLVDKLRAPSMIMFMFSFSSALLAGMGIQHLINLRKEKRADNNPWYRYFLFGYPGLLLLLALLFTVAGESMLSLWTSIFYSDASTEMVQQGVSKLDIAYMNLPAIRTGAWVAFFLTAIASGSLWMFKQGKTAMLVLLVPLAVVVVDGIRFNSRFIELVAPREYKARFEPNPLVEFFHRQEGEFRVADLTDPKSNTLPFFGVQVATGYHGNQLRWYNTYIGPDERHFRSGNPRVLNVTGSRFIIGPASQPFPPNWCGDQPLVKIADLGQAVLYRNDNALPKVFLEDSARVYADYETIAEEVLNGDDPLLDYAWLEEPPPLPLEPDTLGADSAWLIDYQPDTVKVGLAVTGNRLLILSDNYYDAWHASVDGQPTEILRAYGTYRAVPVSAGAREVVFTFRSSRYQTARMVTIVSVIYLLSVLGGEWYLWRRRQAAGTVDGDTDSDDSDDSTTEDSAAEEQEKPE